MNRPAAALTAWLARGLDTAERETVCGDLEELQIAGWRAVAEVAGLVVRRECARWAHAGPWFGVLAIALPLGWLLGIVSRWWADSMTINAWLYFHNWTWSFLTIPGARRDLIVTAGETLVACAALAGWSATAGSALGRLSNRTTWLSGLLFVVVVLAAPMTTTTIARGTQHAAVFSNVFYGAFVPGLLRTALVMLPALAAAWGSSSRTWRPSRAAIVISLAALLVLTLLTERSLEFALTAGRGMFPANAGPDGVMGTADDPRPLWWVALVMMWPAVFLSVTTIRAQARESRTA